MKDEDFKRAHSLFVYALLLASELVSRRKLADEFEVSVSTIDRWCSERSHPHRCVMHYVTRRCCEIVHGREPRNLAGALFSLWFHYVPAGTPVRHCVEDVTINTRTTSTPWIVGDDVLVHIASQDAPVSVCDLEVDVDLCDCMLAIAKGGRDE